jgi:predicted glycosyltransferase
MANILIDLGHPAHVHLFRNAARGWMSQGHRVLFTALDREIILRLLHHYQLPYRVTYKRRGAKVTPGELLLRTLATYRIARQFKADLFVSMGSPTVGLPARLLGKPYLALTDTEPAREQHRLFKPFAAVIATPDVFYLDMGPKQMRYPAYHELMYLHPDEFTPDPAEIRPLGLSPDEPYFLVRLSAWRATHDAAHHGFTPDEKRQMLSELAARGRVLLTAEAGIEPDLKPYIVEFPPEKAHHLLAFARLYVGEGVTMLSEAAQLGVPGVLVNTMNPGYTLDLQGRGLAYICHSGREALERVRGLLAMPDLKTVWAKRRARMLADKINPTPWLVELGNRLIAGTFQPPAR